MVTRKDTIPCGMNRCNGEMTSDKKEWEGNRDNHTKKNVDV